MAQKPSQEPDPGSTPPPPPYDPVTVLMQDLEALFASGILIAHGAQRRERLCGQDPRWTQLAGSLFAQTFDALDSARTEQEETQTPPLGAFEMTARPLQRFFEQMDELTAESGETVSYQKLPALEISAFPVFGEVFAMTPTNLPPLQNPDLPPRGVLELLEQMLAELEKIARGLSGKEKLLAENRIRVIRELITSLTNGVGDAGNIIREILSRIAEFMRWCIGRFPMEAIRNFGSRLAELTARIIQIVGVAGGSAGATGAAGSRLLATLLTGGAILLKVLAAVGIGIVIGLILRRIPVGNGRNLGDAIDDFVTGLWNWSDGPCETLHAWTRYFELEARIAREADDKAALKIALHEAIAAYQRFMDKCLEEYQKGAFRRRIERFEQELKGL